MQVIQNDVDKRIRSQAGRVALSHELEMQMANLRNYELHKRTELLTSQLAYRVRSSVTKHVCSSPC